MTFVTMSTTHTTVSGEPNVNYTLTAIPGPIKYTTDDAVTLVVEEMTVGRPYPYRLAGQWYVAIVDESGTCDIYRFQRPLIDRIRRWLRR